MTRENIIEKIRKLQAHAESAHKLGNVEEAQLFAGKVSELLMRHKLEMSDIDTEEHSQDDEIDSTVVDPRDHGYEFASKRIYWQEHLASIVAHYNFCRIMVLPGRNKIFFVGKAEDRAVAIYLFVYLVKTLAPAAQKAYDDAYYARAAQFLPMPPNFKKSFFIGAITALKNRFDAMRKSVEHEVGESCTALIRKTDAALQKYIDENSSGGNADSIGQASSYSRDGYNKGHDYGSRVELNKALANSQPEGLLT